MWAALIKQYWRVSLFKETPANTPYSPFLLGVVTILFFLLIMTQWQLVDYEKEFVFRVNLFSGLSLVASYLVYTYLLLQVFNLASRMVQTMTCIFAGHIIVHLFAFPLIVMALTLVHGKMPQILAMMITFAYLFLTLLLTAWQFMLSAYLYKEALQIGYLSAILASVGLLAVNILTVSFWR
ncbi:hypothetical protein [Legionella oakridgensis]|uniref:Yip1 domain-containing protein n=2 Tax=Legionella oakridgensis TaxID=29423 RepID=W0BGY8_9GAMM|nr:hypothetical protein [Legionella oakridgensis]AHE67689.1 hypothetical protein Loa_02146 [Legionella oakridgensis ATCC 33761 = DSM 21215]ETO92730.1 hypothetical protein LOR_58c13370 [Legionella oakridgensis RV-2-2007]KTD36977.1 hypothetical protein Loak_2113 [Legionella oakridgensis]STY20714.1 Uncharacterised protein [Legionella longbeachae]